MGTVQEPTALVIDDDRSQLHLTVALLEKEGFRVLPFVSADQALELVSQEPPVDLVVTDLHMPGMDGWRFCRLLRSPEFASWNETPILALSATCCHSDARRVTADLGADAFLSLPFDPSAFRQCVRELLTGQHPKGPASVLIVENDPHFAAQIVRTFESHNYEAYVASTGQEARRLSRQKIPEIVVVNHPLLDEPAESLLEEYKNPTTSVVVIMITGDPDPVKALEWMRKGADGHIRKPFDPEFLIEIVKKAQIERSLRHAGEMLEEQAKRLAESEERYRTLIENQGEGVGIVDLEETFVFANPAAEAIFGTPSGQLVGRTVTQFTDPEQTAVVRAQTKQRCQGERGSYEFEVTRPDGQRRRLLLMATPQRSEEGNVIGTFGIFSDVTEKRKLEQALLKMDHLESLGILAGGIAHDFNNFLVAILGNISLAQLSIEPSDEAHDRLAAAENAALRARDLANQLLLFSEGNPPVKSAASVGQLILETATFATRGSDIRCEYNVPEDLWPAEIDEGQISQVISNLIINAEQAMPDGGVIRVKAENVRIEQGDALPLKPRPYIKIAIQDHGRGIPESLLSKVFDPYFTTKSEGKGLGLATAYSIVARHDGDIVVESVPGVGTTFTFYLPAIGPAPCGSHEQTDRPTSGRGRILVMDDDEIIRGVTHHILRSLDYDVSFACDGAEAIRLFRAAIDASQPFDAVILDLTVPGGMGGRETMQRLLEISPQVKSIVSSGYPNDPVVTDFMKYGFSGRVVKPYKIQDLSCVLNQVINGREAR